MPWYYRYCAKCREYGPVWVRSDGGTNHIELPLPLLGIDPGPVMLLFP